MIYLENFVSEAARRKIVDEMTAKRSQSFSRNNDPLAPRAFNQESCRDFSKTLVDEISGEKFNSLIESIYCLTGQKASNNLIYEQPGFFIYESGSSLGPHSDVCPDGIPSCISFVIYLNSEYEGGELAVYKSSVTEETLQRFSPEHVIPRKPQVVARFKPEPGSIIAFPFNIFHESEKIVSGEKYICTIIHPSDV